MMGNGEKKSLKTEIRHHVRGVHHYNPHETRRMDVLAGVKLASFKKRFWAYVIDLLILGLAMILFSGALMVGYKEIFHRGDPNWNPAGISISPNHTGKTTAKAPKIGAAITYNSEDEVVQTSKGNVIVHVDEKKEKAYKKVSEGLNVIFSVLYFGLMVWSTNGFTVGKRMMGIRVASLLHERITLWQACERALGYGASALELGFGFFQFFIYPNRTCVHDRIAETIVIDTPRVKKAHPSHQKESPA